MFFLGVGAAVILTGIARTPFELGVALFAVGASVGLVAWLHETGGFAIMLQAFASFCLLIVLGAFIFPREHRAPAVRAAG